MTLVAGDGEHHAPGSPVEIDDHKEAERLVERGDASWPNEESSESETHKPEVGAGTVTELPEDFPGRDALLAAGYSTVEGVAAIEDLEEVDGIGPATAGDALEYLDGL